MTTTESRPLVLSVVVAALSAACLRLLPLGWLHPLNYDEIEFFRATDWVRQGLVPYRDFWEHHTPLQWLLFAPFAALTRGVAVDAVVWMRWAQVPFWVATFWLASDWMRRLGASRFGRWSAMAMALASSFLMIAAVEYRVDTIACLLFLAAIVLMLRASEHRLFALAAGVAFTLVIFANLRFAPVVAVTMILFAAIDVEERAWRWNRLAGWMFGGAIGAVAFGVILLFALGSLDAFYRQVFVENYLVDRWVKAMPRGFVHRILVNVGFLFRGTKLTFEPRAIDPGGAALLVLGAVGVGRAVLRWRRPDARFIAALAQIAAVLFVARMKRVYNYHFELVALLMLPFVALEVERMARRKIVATIIVLAWSVNVYASVFRGKELDRAYQNLIMREAHARTLPGEKVWDGVGFAIRREPSYRFWFLPDLAIELVKRGYAEPYRLPIMARSPPALVIADFNALTYLSVDRALRRFVVTHYLPVWRNVWVPAPNARLTPERPGMTWIVCRDGEYRLFASAELANHPWFRVPVWVNLLDRPDAAQFPVRLSRPTSEPPLSWMLDGQRVEIRNGRIRLRKGQRLVVQSASPKPIGVMLVPGTDRMLFRQPPAGVTLEAAYPRQTHVPRFGVKIEAE